MAAILRIMKVAATVVSDEEIVVDKMIAASQRRGEVALPSEGRLLVPYFVPGASVLTEDALNINTDVDAFRRDGASVLDIPTPLGKVGVSTTATNRSQRSRKTFRQFVAGDRTLSSEKVKRFNVARADQSPNSPLDSTPISSPEDSDSTEGSSKPRALTLREEPRTPGRQTDGGESLSLSAPGSITDTAGFNLLELSERRKKNARSKTKKMFATPTKGAPLFSSMPSSPEVFDGKRSEMLSPFLVLSPYEKWAGPAYTKSPPPCNLPLPRFHRKPEAASKLSSQSGFQSDVKTVHLGARSAPVSPSQRDMREQKAMANNALRHAPLLVAPLIWDKGVGSRGAYATYAKDFQPASISESSGIATSNLKKMLQLS